MLIVFIFGILIGSFLNVCIYRIPRGESILFPSSHCPSCKTGLKWLDLIPIFSFLLSKGSCRHCKSSISCQYPVVELITGLLFLLIYFLHGISLEGIGYLILVSILVVVTFIDLEWKIIPNQIIVVGLVSGLLINLLRSSEAFFEGIVGLLLIGGLFLGIAILSKGGMGGGDIKLAAVLGLWLGWKDGFVSVFMSFVIGSVVGILLMALGKKTRKDAVAFGPFLAIGAIMVLLYGDKIVSWYLTIYN